MKCNADAFAAMYRTVYAELYRFAFCMMKNPHDAEDAVSEAVVRAYEHIGALRNEAAFKSWIFTILANTCRKKWRKIEKEQLKEDISCFTPEEGQEEDLALAADVRNAFQILEEEEQLIVGLTVFGGYSSQEIGHYLHKNPSTVRSRLSRALAKMSVLLKEQERRGQHE